MEENQEKSRKWERKEMLMAVLIGERPEEVTDISRSVKGEVFASNFDEPAEDQARVAEIVVDGEIAGIAGAAVRIDLAVGDRGDTEAGDGAQGRRRIDARRGLITIVGGVRLLMPQAGVDLQLAVWREAQRQPAVGLLGGIDNLQGGGIQNPVMNSLTSTASPTA